VGARRDQWSGPDRTVLLTWLGGLRAGPSRFGWCRETAGRVSSVPEGSPQTEPSAFTGPSLSLLAWVGAVLAVNERRALDDNDPP
jgi:hypothetical protein